jgi:hypothetical protein
VSKPSQATILVELALETSDLELFHNGPDGFALIPQGTHRESWPIRSSSFRRWLARLYFNHAHAAPGSQALQDALGVLEGKALFEGVEQIVHLRVAEHEGAIWIDLADEYWQAVRVAAKGWEVVHDPPVRFRRSRGMLPLPYPVKGGTLAELREFVNVDDQEWPLYVAWIVGTIRPRGPYAILLLVGEQGTAKSTAVRVARSLIDPNEAPVRREPKDGQDLIVAARNSHVIAFDNVSRLSLELSDDLARLATGAGFGARQLYTDLDEVIVNVAAPIVLNGIEEFATRGDLLDRALILTPPTIEKYIDEDAFWPRFDEAHPRILGALLDAAAAALTNHTKTPAPNVRMADFARWVSAAERKLGFKSGTFVDAYRANRAAAVQTVLEASLIAVPVQTLAAAGFEGTATELLELLTALVDDTVRKQRDWPKRPHRLSGELRRIAPALRRLGITVEMERSGDTKRTRLIRIQGPTIENEHSEQEGDSASEASESQHSSDASDASDAVSPICSKHDEDELGRLADLAREAQRTPRARLRVHPPPRDLGREPSA